MNKEERERQTEFALEGAIKNLRMVLELVQVQKLAGARMRLDVATRHFNRIKLPAR